MAGGLEEVYHEAEQGGVLHLYMFSTCLWWCIHEVIQKQRVATNYKRHTELAKGAG